MIQIGNASYIIRQNQIDSTQIRLPNNQKSQLRFQTYPARAIIVPDKTKTRMNVPSNQAINIQSDKKMTDPNSQIQTLNNQMSNSINKSVNNPEIINLSTNNRVNNPNSNKYNLMNSNNNILIRNNVHLTSINKGGRTVSNGSTSSQTTRLLTNKLSQTNHSNRSINQSVLSSYLNGNVNGTPALQTQTQSPPPPPLTSASSATPSSSILNSTTSMSVLSNQINQHVNINQTEQNLINKQNIFVNNFNQPTNPNSNTKIDSNFPNRIDLISLSKNVNDISTTVHNGKTFHIHLSDQNNDK